MKNYYVAYDYQGDYDVEPGHDTIILQAESEDGARSKVEWDNRLIHAAVNDVIPCMEIDYVVDLCEGCKTVTSFVVKGLFPEDHSKAQGDCYLSALSTAKSSAYEIISRDYPDYSECLNKILSHRLQYYIQHPADSMVIVRHEHWIENSKQAYWVTAFYKPDRDSCKYCSSHASFSVDVRAKDSEEVRILGTAKAAAHIIGESNQF